MSELVAGAVVTAVVAAILEAAGLDLSRTLVRAWVWTYTVFVPAAKRVRRREEMAELLAAERGERTPAGDDVAMGYSPAARGLRTVWRLAKGAPEDLAWAIPLVLVRIGARSEPIAVTASLLAPQAISHIRRVMDGEQVRRAVVRIADEIVEKHGAAEGLVLVGVEMRGRTLARRIAALIRENEAVDVPVGSMTVGLMGHDPSPKVVQCSLPEIDGASVILVHDVLSDGHAIAAAMRDLVDWARLPGVGRPASVGLVALVDRGHREVPIRADHVGRNVPTAASEGVRVHLVETDGEDGVDVGLVEAGIPKFATM